MAVLLFFSNVDQLLYGLRRHSEAEFDGLGLNFRSSEVSI